MSELAFTVNGDTFEVPNTVTGWRVRRLKPRGAPELVYARDGRPLTLPVEADLDGLNEAVSTSGKYRLDPIGDDGKAVENVLAAYIPLKANGSRSHANYVERLRLYILPILGPVPIALVRKAHVMKWRDDQATRFAATTVNGNLTCLSSAFSYFVDREWVEINPCRGVSRIEEKDAAIYTWIWSREEITKLLIECPKGIREIVTLAVGTGMRLDELVHLQWGDIDLDRRLIAVHRGRHGTTKSGKARYIPILDTLLPFLRELTLKRGGNKLVFPGEDHKPRSKPACASRSSRPPSVPAFRTRSNSMTCGHTFASHWVLDGGDIFRLSKILGHANVMITQKVYAHLAPEAWEQDYHRVSFVVPESGSVYALTKRKSSKATTHASAVQIESA